MTRLLSSFRRPRLLASLRRCFLFSFALFGFPPPPTRIVRKLSEHLRCFQTARRDFPVLVSVGTQLSGRPKCRLSCYFFFKTLSHCTISPYVSQRFVSSTFHVFLFLDSAALLPLGVDGYFPFALNSYVVSFDFTCKVFSKTDAFLTPKNISHLISPESTKHKSSELVPFAPHRTYVHSPHRTQLHRSKTLKNSTTKPQ